MTRRSVFAVVLAAAIIGPGCSTSGLAFRQDHRVAFIEPSDRSEVAVPFTVRWDVDDFDGTFAVLVDRTPPPPDQTIAWLFRNDDSCRVDDDCPDEARLADENIYLTATPQVVIPRVPRSTATGRDLHDVVVILLDHNGRRVGESAFRLELEIDRPGA